MIIPVSVKNQSIDSSGITSDYKAAISEYIWNGFEANAKKVSIEYTPVSYTHLTLPTTPYV